MPSFELLRNGKLPLHAGNAGAPGVEEVTTFVEYDVEADRRRPHSHDRASQANGQRTVPILVVDGDRVVEDRLAGPRLRGRGMRPCMNFRLQ
jgi:glutaredoxin